MTIRRLSNGSRTESPARLRRHSLTGGVVPAAVAPSAQVAPGSWKCPLPTVETGCPFLDDQLHLQEGFMQGGPCHTALSTSGPLLRHYCPVVPSIALEAHVLTVQDSSTEDDEASGLFTDFASSFVVPTEDLVALVPGSASEQGQSKHAMEDRHVVLDGFTQALAAQHAAQLAGLSSAFVGVFDGHAGGTTAKRAAARVSPAVMSDVQLWQQLVQGAHEAVLEDAVVEGVQGALRRIMKQLDDAILEEDRMKPPGTIDGSTALVGLQVGQHLFTVNLGDCRAVLKRGELAVRLTTDHTPAVAAEQQRITAAGGKVGMRRGIWRVALDKGYLGTKFASVSRGLGDVDFKEPCKLISSEADVTYVPLQPDDQYIIFASDGVWGVVDDQQAVEIVSSALTAARLAGVPTSELATSAASALMWHARLSGSNDDISVVVCPLPGVAHALPAAPIDFEAASLGSN